MIVAVALLAQLGGSIGPMCSAMLQRPAGTAWIYHGTRAWSTATGTDTGSVTWAMTLARVRSVAGLDRVALIRGFVTELAWSDPTSRPELSVVTCHGGVMSHYNFDHDSEAVAFYEGWPATPAPYADTVLVEPLKDGAQWGGDTTRSDLLYRWIAAPADSLPPFPASCRHGPAAFDASLTTLPDNQLITWVAGVGIAHYYYWHHGTPAAAEVWLADCRAPTPP